MTESTLSLSQLLSQRHPLPQVAGGLAMPGAAEAQWGSAAVSLEGLAQARLQAEQEWLGGIAALAKLLVYRISLDNQGLDQPSQPDVKPRPTQALTDPLGIVLSGPFPVLPDRLLGRSLSHWLLVPEPLERILAVARPMLPGQAQGTFKAPVCDLQMVPLATEDPLAQERFCLLLTAHFSLVLALGEDGQGNPAFQFSFDPDTVQQAWQQLRLRIAHTRPPLLTSVDRAVDQFPPVVPDYRLVTQYSHLLVQQLRTQGQPHAAAVGVPAALSPSARPTQFAALELPATESVVAQPARLVAAQKISAFTHPLAAETAPPPCEPSPDTELLKAMAHEIRTPLTTIRTLTRSLLKRKDVSDEVAKRLRSIDRECTQQIDRFNLIFRAVELETEATKQPKSPLSAFSLNQLFQDAIPLWQQQASRRNHTLTVNLPPQLPMVNSDPTMLHQVLTGLIDRFTHSLPSYSHIELAVTLAGHQLKLQFQSQPPESTQTEGKPDAVDTLLSSPFKALGQLLIFQPETGGLSLNIQATKNLFQSLGGKLIVRQRPQAGEVLTVFLPLETRTL